MIFNDTDTDSAMEINPDFTVKPIFRGMGISVYIKNTLYWKCVLKVLPFFFISYGCSIHKETSKNNFAFELCRMYGLDQGIRNYDIKFNRNEVMPKIDSANFYHLISLIKKNGYPNPKNVGKKNWKDQECVHLAAVAILLHNPQRVVHDNKVKNLFLKEIEKGNMNREFLAVVLDKYYWVKKGNNRKVYYGTQFGKPCIEDRIKSDSLRKSILLPPLKLEDFKKCK